MKTYINRLRSVWKKNGILFLKAIVLLLSLFKILCTFIPKDNLSDWWFFFADFSFMFFLIGWYVDEFSRFWIFFAEISLIISLIIGLIISVASLILVPFKKKVTSLIGIIGILILNVSDAVCCIITCIDVVTSGGVVTSVLIGNLIYSALIILISVCLLRRISQRAKKAEEQSEKQEDAPEETVCLNEA